MTVPQEKLFSELEKVSTGWYIESGVSNGKTYYKADIANTSERIAIEIDGPSHGAIRVKEMDAKKTAVFISRGWKVLRFKNQEVMEHLAEVVQEVLSTISP